MTDSQKPESIGRREAGVNFSETADVTGASGNAIRSFRRILMNNKDFKREMNYQLTMSYIRQLKRNGAITKDEYNQIDAMMLKKHRPILGTLLSGNRWT